MICACSDLWSPPPLSCSHTHWYPFITFCAPPPPAQRDGRENSLLKGSPHHKDATTEDRSRPPCAGVCVCVCVCGGACVVCGCMKTVIFPCNCAYSMCGETLYAMSSALCVNTIYVHVDVGVCVCVCVCERERERERERDEMRYCIMSYVVIMYSCCCRRINVSQPF